jgi:L,D-transpeptidase catalytic domain
MSSHVKKVNRALTTIIVFLSLAIIITFVIGVYRDFNNSTTNKPIFLPDRPAKVEEIASSTSEVTENTKATTTSITLGKYIKVTDSCGAHFEEDCLVVRSGPGKEFPVVTKLRNGIVLKISETLEQEDGSSWHKIIFDEWLRYPERVKGDWYVSADYVETLEDIGDLTIWENEYSTSTNKKIVVSRTEQSLKAYDGEELFMSIDISTGLALTPTPRGTFQVFKKTPSRYMQGPLPGLADQQVYDLPGVPWNLYFTDGGAVIHGAYWHKSFGQRYSHGCVNVDPDEAKKLYDWADLGTAVVVKD